jgi:hypothetical protein
MERLLQLWDKKPQASVLELPHPELYGAHISQKIQEKYSAEQVWQKSSRLEEDYQELLCVVKAMEIPREYILELNGFKNH